MPTAKRARSAPKDPPVRRASPRTARAGTILPEARSDETTQPTSDSITAPTESPASPVDTRTPTPKARGTGTAAGASASAKRTRKASARTPEGSAAGKADLPPKPTAAPAAPAAPAEAAELPEAGAMAADGLSAYERERLANLERNRRVLESLGLINTAKEIKDETLAAAGRKRAAPSARGLAQPKKKEAALPARPRSLRAQGKTPDGQFANGVHEEGSDGSIVIVVNGEAIRYSAAAAAAIRNAEPAARREAAERAARLDSDAPFRSVHCSAKTDAVFIRLLASAPSAAPPSARAAGGTRGGTGAGADAELAVPQGSAPSLARLSALSLREEHVAKLTPRDIVHLCFQPRSDCLVLCAADKAGHVAVWQVGATTGGSADAAPRPKAKEEAEGAEEEEEEEGGAPDGVLLLRPHAQYVSGLRWSAHRPSHLFTASYDGTVRRLELSRAPAPVRSHAEAAPAADGEQAQAAGGGSGAAFALVMHAAEHEISALEVDAAGQTAFFADNHGALGVIDVRARSLASGSAPLALHDRKVNMLSLDSDGVRLASCSTDSTVCVWDVRTLGKGCKPAHTLTHGKSCQSACWAPDGSGRLLTTCYDDNLRIWDSLALKGSSAQAGAAKASLSLGIRHNCNTGRWIVPFRAIWTPAADGVIVGSMQRQMHLISAASGKLAKAYDSELMTAIPARNAAHPSLPVLAGGTASGRAHVFAAD